MAMVRYVVLLLILVIPAAAVDDVIGGLEATGIRYIIRVLWILLVFAVLRLIPKPESH